MERGRFVVFTPAWGHHVNVAALCSAFVYSRVQKGTSTGLTLSLISLQEANCGSAQGEKERKTETENLDGGSS